ncbi:MAG: protein phosphatase 2C domain-containing protein [Alphaproteobacteria bacterium]
MTVSEAAPPARAAPWAIRARSVAKPKNDVFGSEGQVVVRPNEDRFRVADLDDGVVAAVSDGAGSSGLYCGAWAQTLVENLPGTPIDSRDVLDRWMGGFWKGFADDMKRQAAATPARHSKLVREGSCATLTACWLRTVDDVTNLHWIGYGDSPLCVFEWHDDQPVLTACYPKSLTQFDAAPYLLNWKDLPQEAHVHVGTATLPPRATVIIASDGIGQYLLLRFLSSLGPDAVGDGVSRGLQQELRRMMQSSESKLGETARQHTPHSNGGFAVDLAELRSALDSDETFAEMVRDWYERGLMVNDDATVIMIDVDTSPVVVEAASDEIACEAPPDPFAAPPVDTSCSDPPDEISE